MKIDLGEMWTLDMDVVVAAPCPEIYIGPRRRIDPGPPTTRALADALARWQEESAGKEAEGAGTDKIGQGQHRAGDVAPSSDPRA